MKSIINRIWIGETSHRDLPSWPIGTRVKYYDEVNNKTVYGIVHNSSYNYWNGDYTTIRWDHGTKIPLDQDIKFVNGLEIAKLKATDQL